MSLPRRGGCRWGLSPKHFRQPMGQFGLRKSLWRKTKNVNKTHTRVSLCGRGVGRGCTNFHLRHVSHFLPPARAFFLRSKRTIFSIASFAKLVSSSSRSASLSPLHHHQNVILCTTRSTAFSSFLKVRTLFFPLFFYRLRVS